MNAAQQQPTPTGNGPDITSLVVEDLKTRADFGEKKYGQRLRAHNGRDALLDLYQELLDACVYIRQEIKEREDARMRPTGRRYNSVEELMVGENLSQSVIDEYQRLLRESTKPRRAKLPKAVIDECNRAALNGEI